MARFSILLYAILATVSQGMGVFFNEDPCRDLGGYCMPSSGNCPGGSFVSGKCPRQSSDIRCCKTVPYDEPQCISQGGTCLDDERCSSGTQLSGKCPTQPSGVKCCIQGSCSQSCGPGAKNYACKILELSRGGKIDLKRRHFDNRGNNPYDGASAYDNIADTCSGKMAKRSSYGKGKGGCVCLQEEMLRNLYNYANSFYSSNRKPIEVSSIAGSSHSANSNHYRGTTFDVPCKRPKDHCKDLENFCRRNGADELCYPGSSCGGHATWVHCTFK